MEPSIDMRTTIAGSPSPTEMEVDVSPSTTEVIVFSDLHVKLSNWPLCKQVLEHVHAEAVRLGAKVIFGGDCKRLS